MTTMTTMTKVADLDFVNLQRKYDAEGKCWKTFMAGRTCCEGGGTFPPAICYDRAYAWVRGVDVPDACKDGRAIPRHRLPHY